MALYAFDGTWNRRDLKDAVDSVLPQQYGDVHSFRRDTIETNVHRFGEFYGEDQVEYLQGVGTQGGVFDKLFGGAFGLGGRNRIRRMYRALTKRYFSGDEVIDIVGFSRGAAQAVHFTNLLDRHGLRHPDNPRHLAWWYYPELGWTFRHPKSGPNDVQQPEIRFLGLWDTVATFGIPFWKLRNRWTVWKFRTIPKIVRSSFHAMALDEVRATFALVRPFAANPKKHYEVWFRGVHANVGGGYDSRGLSDIALAWMMEMAVWAWRKTKDEACRRFREVLDMLEAEPGLQPQWMQGGKIESLEPNPDGELGRPLDLRRQAWRELEDCPKVHHTAYRRAPNLISDHGGSGRALIRRIPADAARISDPPMIYRETRKARARTMASLAWDQVPVRPCKWLRCSVHYVFRSDHWIALGSQHGRSDREGVVGKFSKASFLQVVEDWICAGRPKSLDADVLSAPLIDPDGAEVADPADCIQKIVGVLCALTPYLPREATAELD